MASVVAMYVMLQALSRRAASIGRSHVGHRVERRSSACQRRQSHTRDAFTHTTLDEHANAASKTRPAAAWTAGSSTQSSGSSGSVSVAAGIAASSTMRRASAGQRCRSAAFATERFASGRRAWCRQIDSEGKRAGMPRNVPAATVATSPTAAGSAMMGSADVGGSKLTPRTCFSTVSASASVAWSRAGTRIVVTATGVASHARWPRAASNTLR
mmetsp:Transcript_26195/g.80915  ORF Transcript_26195/g.80915 Transcript_26195/m.80915 type:complete len:213 (-) Transcript_26195:395-1033(-)